MMKREALPDLRLAFEDATRRFEEASKAREQKHKVDELKKELAWAHVRAKREVCCFFIIIQYVYILRNLN
jgi:structural maintenance of chromosomes protein 6